MVVLFLTCLLACQLRDVSQRVPSGSRECHVSVEDLKTSQQDRTRISPYPWNKTRCAILVGRPDPNLICLPLWAISHGFLDSPAGPLLPWLNYGARGSSFLYHLSLFSVFLVSLDLCRDCYEREREERRWQHRR